MCFACNISFLSKDSPFVLLKCKLHVFSSASALHLRKLGLRVKSYKFWQTFLHVSAHLRNFPFSETQNVREISTILINLN